MPKSADAFRTISEVAEWLETPAHVLRFWESKFSQVKPVKRAGGRRYYRPTDMQLLGGIKKLLHEDGMTIKGVQKMLREQGIKQVAALSQPLDEVTNVFAEEMAGDISPDVSAANVLSFQRDEVEADSEAPQDTAEPISEPEGVTGQAMTAEEEDAAEPLLFRHNPEAEKPAEPESAAAESAATDAEETVPSSAETEKAPPSEAASLPSFLSRPKPETADPPADGQEPADIGETPETATPDPEPAPAPVTVPEDPQDDIPADPGVLAALTARRRVTPALARQLEDLAARLKALHG